MRRQPPTATPARAAGCGTADDVGLGDRVAVRRAAHRRRLAAPYAAADALVLATRAESYGMVVTEALARGLPVLATAAGGLPEALGRLPDGRVPGVLVPPDDPAALAAALRRWLTDARHRAAPARRRGRGAGRRWPAGRSPPTGSAHVLEEVAA